MSLLSFQPDSRSDASGPGGGGGGGGSGDLPKKKKDDFTFDKIIGEGSYSTVS